MDKAINYANIAVEDDPDLYEKFQEDTMFVIIKDKIKKPDLSKKTANRNSITEKENKIFKHMDYTCRIVGKLNNNDLQMIENTMKIKEKNNDEKQIDNLL